MLWPSGIYSNNARVVFKIQRSTKGIHQTNRGGKKKC